MPAVNLNPRLAAPESGVASCEITPQILPLVSLDQAATERIAALVPGGAANIQDICPLTPLQEGMLFHHLLDAQGDAYVRQVLLEIETDARLDALISALQAVIERQDILRTAIFWEQLPKPVQVVYRRAQLPVEELAAPLGGVAGYLEKRMLQEKHRLDLRHAPLMKLQICFDRDSVRWFALLQSHHLVSDGQSHQLLIDEVLSHVIGRSAELSQPAPLRLYLERALQQAQSCDAELYFRRKLGDVDEPTAPFQLLDIRGDGSRIVEASRPVETGLGARIRAGARRSRVSVAAVFHAAWAVVVAKTSGRNDVVFGTVLFGRLQMRSEFRRTLGMFLNTMPVRLRLDGLSAEELLAQTHQELLELWRYDQSSLVVARRCSGIAGNAPLFSALLNYRHGGREEEEWGRVPGVREVASTSSWTGYPVALSVEDFGDSFDLRVKVDSSVDPQKILAYMHTALQSLLQMQNEAPGAPVLSASILPETEWQEIVRGFNSTHAAYPQDKLIHELFEEQVDRTPDAVAAVFEGLEVTYAQLNERANKLARYVLERGLGPDRLAGVFVERSLEMVVGLLGILKSGGAYLPLDPTYPPDRLQYMLKDAAPRVLLIQEHLRQALPDTAAMVIALDRDWIEIAQRASDNLTRSAHNLCSRHLAYVIYTSGSTGKPKGAMNEHRGVVNRLQWMQDAYRLDSADRVLQKTPYSFDVSVWEFFWTLISGARLVVARPQGHRDPGYLRELIEATGVTTLHFVPSMLQSFLEGHPAGACASVTHVVCSGEELTAPLQRKFFERMPQSRLSNLYGPTEAAVDVTAWECVRDDESPRVPIGQPISNIQMYLLDRYGQPVPIGVTGEIYIGGAGVARGYLNRPELTRERFVSDPFSTDPGARMYRTGDLGRWRADGNIEYLGRNDHQVKIRGYRIELGEIETQLMQCAQIRDAVVIAREDELGEKRLVAYFTRREGTSADIEALRTHLKGVLPEYMVPSAFVMLESLPLTSSGKLDRRALPAPDLGAYVSRQYEAPHGEIEENLARIWQGLLRVQRVGRHDNFFELGGHSLLIVQLLERLRRVGLSAEIRRMFDSPTLADLASVLTRGSADQLDVPQNRILAGCERITPEMLPLIDLQQEHLDRISSAVLGGAGNIQDIYPLAPLQEGILFHHLLGEQGGDIYVLPMLLSLPSRERLEAFINALQAMIGRHDVLRTAVLWEQLPQPIQLVHRRATLPVQEVALDPNRDPRQQVEEWVAPERQRLDLRQAPLLRLQFAVDPHSKGCYALLQLHHLACDHESIAILFSEVVDYLESRVPPVTSFMPYREHVAQILANARTHDPEAFFRGKLHDIDQPTAPFGLLDVQGNGTQIDEAHETVEPALAVRLRAQARRLGVSAATLFHATWGLVVARTSGRDDVVFGSVLSGRFQGSAGAQRILGMFINTLPLRLRLKGIGTRDLVLQTQQELVELLSYEQASLAVAQRCSGVAGPVALFTALLNYRHSLPDSGADWGSRLGIEVIGGQERTNYPITFTVDDLGAGFELRAQTDRRIDPRRMTAQVHTALRSLLNALESADSSPVLSLSILPAAERRQVVDMFNATQTEYPEESLVHELFEEQAQRTPDAIAALYEGNQLTYAELNRRANQLAWYLAQHGVQEGEFVPIIMERGLQMLIAQLAVLKSGGTYVPVDPEFPHERQAFMLRDCGAVRILAEGPAAGAFAPETSQWINCQDLSTVLAALPGDNLCRPKPASPSAYAMYTSGSTGTPKGVVVPHRAINRLVFNNGYAQIDPADCVAHCSNPAFDASTFEIWAALLNGAKVLIVPHSTVLDPKRLGALIDEQSVTVMFLTTGLFARCVNELMPAFGRLRYLLVGGDVVEPEMIRRLLQSNPPGNLLNAYGPTECTTFSTTYLVKVIDCSVRSLPIGRPISNGQVYILDELCEVVPIGVTGEIYIGGAGVARGYLNRPELTRERFVSDPFSTDPGARMYRTGDLGRWRADGNIEYLGRNDHQVKIRGYRIELGEIETQLMQCAQIRDAVVIAREDELGEKRLVAYFTRREGTSADIEALRTHLKGMLPEYMVPSAFVMLESLPLTSSGKLDRRALPAPDLGAYVSRQYEAPQGEIEQALSRIWIDVLAVDSVGRKDNFFDLGGHSLLGMKLISQVADCLGVRPPIVTIFQFPTIHQMAQLVEHLLLDDLRAGVADRDGPEGEIL